MMDIVIPSLGRAGSCASMKWLQESKRNIIFAVHQDEAETYEKAYPKATIYPLSEHCRKHTGLVRREIMDQIDEPFIFVDDDIRLSFKTVIDVDTMFDVLETHINNGASMAGLGQQLFCNAQMYKAHRINDDPWAIRNKFVATVYAINPTHFDDCPLEHLPVYEDIALVIHAIQYGGGTITSYIATHSNVSPSQGGCNSWRDPKITIDSLNKLCELYPDICSIRPTTNTTHSQNIGIGLRTAWSKIRKLK
jgi:hypothetical protein